MVTRPNVSIVATQSAAIIGWTGSMYYFDWYPPMLAIVGSYVVCLLAAAVIDKVWFPELTQR